MRAAKEGRPLPTKMGYRREVLDDDSHQFLSVLSDGHKMCAEYDMDIMVRLVSTFLHSNLMEHCLRQRSELPMLVRA
jgi:hypothetical protein